MTAAEAKDILDRCVIGDCELCNNNKKHFGSCEGSDYAFSAISEAKKALDKQIPKKPYDRVKLGEKTIIGTCPECGGGNNSEYPYCGVCGQALDWESVNKVTDKEEANENDQKAERQNRSED